MELPENIRMAFKTYIRDPYRHIRQWWRCNGSNPYHWKLVWYTSVRHHPWDYIFTYGVMRLMLLKSLWYFTHGRHVISDEHLSEIIRWQKISVRLLDTLIDDGRLWTMVPASSDSHPSDFPEWFRSEYKCLVHVNTGNMKRFAARCDDWETGRVAYSTEGFGDFPHELYLEKARRLLFRILEEHGNDWWE